MLESRKFVMDRLLCRLNNGELYYEHLEVEMLVEI